MGKDTTLIKNPRLIGLSGKARSGKNTAAYYIQERLGEDASIDSFAGNLKRVCMEAFGFTANQVYGNEKLVVDSFWGNTPVYFLQKVGTELFRNMIDKDFWCKSLMKTVDRVLEYEDNIIIIDDVRFPNEADAIKERGGILIRINREERPDTGRDPNHPSEIALDDYEGFDYIIDNDGTIEELYNKLEVILEQYNNHQSSQL